MGSVAAFLLVLCYLADTYAWTCREGPQLYGAVQIDAGWGQVVMRDRNNQVYFLSGSTWYALGTVRLKHVSVGPAGIWGADASDRVYKYVAGNFVVSEGLSMQQVDAGGDGEVVGVTSTNSVYCMKSTTASAFSQIGILNWVSLSRILIYFSCSPLYGCWGTDAANRIFLTKTITPNTCEISEWLPVDGAAKMVEVGTDGSVFVLNAQGSVFQRLGISSSNLNGTHWNQISLCMPVIHVSYDLGKLWIVTSGGSVMLCSQ